MRSIFPKAILALGLPVWVFAHEAGGIPGVEDDVDTAQAPPSATAAPSAPPASATVRPGAPADSALELPAATAVRNRPVNPFNAQVIRDRDLSLRMMLDPADVVKVTPGLFVGQHAGGGKANQYFIRGFDIDHGTDLALWLDGMPINNVSHAHGQGYADLHFLIPEIIENVEVDKGPYYAEFGDFATAGAVRLDTREAFKENRVSGAAGMFGTYRTLALLTLKDAPMKPMIAAEVFRSDGPFRNPEDMERYNLFLKTPLVRDEATRLDLTLMGYGAGWNGSGQIPERAVKAGLDRFGSIDPSEGGSSQRHSASLDYSSLPSDREEWKASAYWIDYRLSLFSDFTFFARDPVRGDEINQRDDRTVAGLNASYKRKYGLGGMEASSAFGIGMRNDLIHNVLDYAEKRVVFDHAVDADVREGSLGAWFMQSLSPWKWLYLEAGVRGDHYGFDVADRLHPEGDSTLTGVKDASILSPKVNVVVTPAAGTDIYLNYGEGFHSNDARGIASKTDPARPLTKARGYEIGARTELLKRIDLAASLWKLDLDGELVWVGDEGGTEENGASERMGVDLEARVRILPWLWADFDMTKSTSEYVKNAGNGTAVALAPRLTWTGGLSWRHRSGFFGSLRGQHLDDRPADEAGDFTAQGFTVFDLGTGFRHGRYEVDVNVANLFDADWRTAQFENDSRLPGESAPVTDIHFVPGAPVNVQGVVKYFF
jgi:outer membrane receptor protein involved in Fe transport